LICVDLTLICVAKAYGMWNTLKSLRKNKAYVLLRLTEDILIKIFHQNISFSR
jgi:hypothetical protein